MMNADEHKFLESVVLVHFLSAFICVYPCKKFLLEARKLQEVSNVDH